MKNLTICLFLVLCFSSCTTTKQQELSSGKVGNLIVETPDEKDKRLTEEEKVFYLQEKERDRQQRDIEDLERQRYYNQKIRDYGLEE